MTSSATDAQSSDRCRVPHHPHSEQPHLHPERKVNNPLRRREAASVGTRANAV
jgi:hypothetical protein